MPLFMVRTEFYDAIMSGMKRTEWRAGRRWAYLIDQQPDEAVFMCGRRRHRRQVLSVRRLDRNRLEQIFRIPRVARNIYPFERFFYAIVLGEIIIEEGA